MEFILYDEDVKILTVIWNRESRGQFIVPNYMTRLQAVRGSKKPNTLFPPIAH